jgi:galactokinase
MIGKNTPLQALGVHTASEFRRRTKAEPQWIAAAPGRVNLIGEHTDYNDGFVFPMALERYTVIAAAPNGTSRIHLTSSAASSAAEIDLKTPIVRGEPSWANYVKGVIVGFQRLGCRISGFNAHIESTVPVGGSVSSSAALEVATATLLEAITGKRLSQVEKGLLCQKAEHEFALMPCGIMDQFISVMARAGHALLLDCQSLQTRHVPMRSNSVSVLVINTNVKHELTGSEYPDRRRQCEAAARALGVKSLRSCTLADVNAATATLSNIEFRRARHIVTEIDRTTAAARSFARGDWETAGELMYASHGSLRGDFEVSCPELDQVVNIAHGIGVKGGVYGCRMTGGGFGGCCVALVQSAKVRTIAAKITRSYRARTGIRPALFVSIPGQGATLLKPGSTSRHGQ